MERMKTNYDGSLPLEWHAAARAMFVAMCELLVGWSLMNSVGMFDAHDNYRKLIKLTIDRTWAFAGLQAETLL